MFILYLNQQNIRKRSRITSARLGGGVGGLSQNDDTADALGDGGVLIQNADMLTL